MDVVPISIDHASQFSDVIMTIAREDIFAIRSEDLSSKSVYRFVERQLVDGAPMFVAREKGQVVGWCEISLFDLEYSDHCGVLSMGVLKGMRSRGIGRKLIKKCLAAAANMGLERIELSVLENNPDAQRFYASVGFSIEGRKSRSLRINDVYHDEIMMGMIIPEQDLLDSGLRMH